jgi:transposase
MNRRQTIPKHLRYTLQQFSAEFPTDDACLETLKDSRYPGGVVYCADCEQERKLYRVKGRPAYACESGHHFYPLAGTIFEHSSTPLKLWFYAMYQMGSTRCGISAKQIQRETGVTYKTAWRMFRQIRSLLNDDDKMEGPTTVEMDEMYFGGRRKQGRGRPMRGDKQMTPVIGIMERSTDKRLGRVKAVATPDVTSERVIGLVHEHILPKSTVFTDEYTIYDRLGARVQEHKRIKHSAAVYVIGDVHTNTIEGFWSLVKRGIGGVYHSVSQKYLQTYLNEYSFRYNRRDRGNLLFTEILKRVSERASERPAPKSSENPPV